MSHTFLSEFEVLFFCIVPPEGLLHHPRVLIVLSLSALLQQEQALRILDEEFRPTELILICIHMYTFKQVHNPSLHVSSPLRPRFRSEDGIAAEEFVKHSSVRISCSSHTDVLLQAEVFYLMFYSEKEA